VVSNRWKTALRISAVWSNGGICAVRVFAGRASLPRCSRTVPTRDEASRCEAATRQPITITHIPYGYIRRETEDGLYCIGDQAAVIPRSPAMHIHRAAYCPPRRRCLSCRGAGAGFQPQLRSAMLPRLRLADLAADSLNNALARAVLPFCLRIWPGAMRVTARLTRVTQHATVPPMQSPADI